MLGPGGALEALKEAKQAGKIKHIGITGHDYDLLVEGIQTNEFSTVQAPFNAVELKALERLFPLAREMDIGRIVMKPLGGGQIESKINALRFILGNDITVAIPGMDEVGHVRENLSAADPFVPLSIGEKTVFRSGSGRTRQKLLPSLWLLHALRSGDRNTAVVYLSFAI